MLSSAFLPAASLDHGPGAGLPLAAGQGSLLTAARTHDAPRCCPKAASPARSGVPLAARLNGSHTAATRTAHLAHYTRHGFSGMCPGTSDSALAALRATLTASGATAESPATLDAEGEQRAREERWT